MNVSLTSPEYSMEENRSNWGWIIILIIALVWAIFFHKDKYEGQTAEEWYNDYADEEHYHRVYRDALEEANDNIETAKRSLVWEDYDMMESALRRLDTVEP